MARLHVRWSASCRWGYVCIYLYVHLRVHMHGGICPLEGKNNLVVEWILFGRDTSPLTCGVAMEAPDLKAILWSRGHTGENVEPESQRNCLRMPGLNLLGPRPEYSTIVGAGEECYVPTPQLTRA